VPETPLSAPYHFIVFYFRIMKLTSSFITENQLYE
jgi:hypothetical protein